MSGIFSEFEFEALAHIRKLTQMASYKIRRAKIRALLEGL